jgi:hypothetical protein
MEGNNTQNKMEVIDMKLYDKNTGVVIATITTNHSMSIDDALELMGYTLDGEGQILDEDGNLLDAWYDDLEMDW